MNSLYEVTNGWTGESHFCCYVWASSPYQAYGLGELSYQEKAAKDNYPPEFWKNLTVRLLFTLQARPFATEPSGSGWHARGEVE